MDTHAHAWPRTRTHRHTCVCVHTGLRDRLSLFSVTFMDTNLPEKNHKQKFEHTAQRAGSRGLPGTEGETHRLLRGSPQHLIGGHRPHHELGLQTTLPPIPETHFVFCRLTHVPSHVRGKPRHGVRERPATSHVQCLLGMLARHLVCALLCPRGHSHRLGGTRTPDKPLCVLGCPPTAWPSQGPPRGWGPHGPSLSQDPRGR